MHVASDWMATVPPEFTKTDTDYIWLLPNEIMYAVELVQSHQGTGYSTSEKFREGLDNFYEK